MDKVSFPYRSSSHLTLLHVIAESGAWAKHGLGEKTMPKKIAALAAALLACCWALPVAAQDAVAQFYRGKTVTIVVGASAGSGYDTYARLLGRYLGKHLPGEPTVIVSNMNGAGSEIAAAYVARAAPKDGTYIAAPIRGPAARSHSRRCH